MSAQPPTHDVQTTSAARQSREQEPDEDAMLLAFFDRIATALSSGDATTLASCWRTPALVVGDGGVHAVSSNAEVEALFASAREQYTSRGIRATRAEIARVHWVGLHTAIAEVRWPLLDAQQRELGKSARRTYCARAMTARSRSGLRSSTALPSTLCISVIPVPPTAARRGTCPGSGRS